jgi:isoleucyl-tRNA synthetase
VTYQNCIVVGHVNDEKGRKMSKRLGNVVDPMAVVAETGADALRWYFYSGNPELTSRFSAKLVRESVQRFLLPLANALSFFTIYANLDGWRPGGGEPEFASRPPLDRWILLRLDRLIASTTEHLEAYRIPEAARACEELVDDLTNWYIRRSRARFWSETGDPVADAEKESAYQALYEVLCTLARLIAPFVPFFAEVLHRTLVRSQLTTGPESVHLEAWPRARGDRQEPALEAGMAAVFRAVRLGHAARNTHNLKTRQPLASVTLVTADAGIQAAAEPYLDLLADELNVKQILWAADRSRYVHHEVRPMYPRLGPRLGKRMGELRAALDSADGDLLAAELERTDRLVVPLADGPFELAAEDVEVRLIERPGTATQGDRELLVALDTALSPELIDEGRAREVVHKIQAARKEARLDYADRIRVRYRAAAELAPAMATWSAWIARETLAVELLEVAVGDLSDSPVEDLSFAFAIEKA